MSQLRGQIAHQEKRNNELFASNATLRKLNSELTVQMDELKVKNEKLKSRNKELVADNAALVERNAELKSRLDGVRDELAGEKAISVGLKAELETAAEKVQSIAVDAVLSARAELMGEFKRGEHSAWDPDEEIETWRKRQAVLAGIESASDGEASDEEEAPALESPKPQDGDAIPKLGEPAAGAERVEPEPDDVAASEDPSAGAEDIAKD